MPKRKIMLPLLLTRAYFRQHAKPLAVTLDQVGAEEARPREYPTGSLGWQWVCRARIKVGNCYAWAQINLTVTLIGSKDLPRDGPTQGADAGGESPAPGTPRGGSGLASA